MQKPLASEVVVELDSAFAVNAPLRRRLPTLPPVRTRASVEFVAKVRPSAGAVTAGSAEFVGSMIALPKAPAGAYEVVV